ncbi:MAG: carbohydrate ABC transporter permease, partial [Nesterenkonia sp.]
MSAAAPLAPVEPEAETEKTMGRRRSSPRRGRVGGAQRRPGFLVYGCLAAVVLGGMFPLWWSYLIGSHHSTILSETSFPWWPGGNFWTNASAVLDSIPFWRATMNSIIVSTVTAFSVVIFSTLAGYAFAKLRFRGSGPLLVFVIATMAVPTQLGVVPL